SQDRRCDCMQQRQTECPIHHPAQHQGSKGVADNIIERQRNDILTCLLHIKKHLPKYDQPLQKHSAAAESCQITPSDLFPQNISGNVKKGQGSKQKCVTYSKNTKCQTHSILPPVRILFVSKDR